MCLPICLYLHVCMSYGQCRETPCLKTIPFAWVGPLIVAMCCHVLSYVVIGDSCISAHFNVNAKRPLSLSYFCHPSFVLCVQSEIYGTRNIALKWKGILFCVALVADLRAAPCNAYTKPETSQLEQDSPSFFMLTR